ncbi:MULTISPECIES: superinfection exclusion B family protein [unclassified Rhodanobacter]|uniref:Superinfection exclusion B family protein n=1 Tax=Rhodanobacter humi TaxID=1888173 RepID=A0ABV4AUY1_9GAMM
MDVWKGLIEFLKLAPRYLVAIALGAGLLVFLPESTQRTLGLDGVIHSYRGWFGVTLIASLSTLSVWIALIPINAFQQARQERKRRARLHDRLYDLTEGEKQILRYYLAKNTRSNRLKIDDGTVNGLVMSGVIYRAANQGSLLSGFDHNITDEALMFISAHPEVLQGSTNTYRTDRSHFDGI